MISKDMKSQAGWKTATIATISALTPLSAMGALAPHVPGEIIVKFKEDKGAESFLSQKFLGILSNKQLTLSYGNIHIVSVPVGEKSISSTIDRLLKDERVEYAEPNYLYTIGKPKIEAFSVNQFFVPSEPSTESYTPNDPQYGQLWGLENMGNNEPNSRRRGTPGADIDAKKAWDITIGSKAIKVAVIDTGVDYNHPDLKNNMWTNLAELNGQPGVDDDGNGYIDDVHGYDFANNDGNPMDGNGHGTHCAGTIGAVHNNGAGVAGVMGEVSMVALKFLTDSGSGSTTGAIQAIDYATKLGVDIMSNSWGGGGRSNALEEAIVRAKDQGILFVAAAGNSGTNNDRTPHYPSNYDVENVISVAAHTAQDELASFSCYGERTVHIAAPGHNILSTYPNNRYDVLSGTSMATPHVSGALGLLLAHRGKLDVEDVRNLLMDTSTPVATYRGKIVKGGRMNTHNLLTGSIPDRNEPDPAKWTSMPLQDAWESYHPYDNNVEEQQTFTVPGAKFIRLKITRFELEDRYDYIQLADGNDVPGERVTGSGQDYETNYIAGDTIIATFKSDDSVTKWGFLIEEVQYQ